MPPLRNPYAVPFAEKKGRLVPPSEDLHALKLKAGCTCPGCHATVRVRRSKLNNLHFAHLPSASCTGGFETAIHRMAKQIIEDEARLLLPLYIHTFQEDVEGEELKETVRFSAQWTRLINIQQEIRLDRWVPDVTAEKPDGTPVYIEIYVTHAVEEAKSEAITNLVEIDLSKLSDDIIFDTDRFRDQVLSKAPRHWYLCTIFNQQRKFIASEARLGEKVTEYRQWLTNKRSVRQQYASDLERLQEAISGNLIKQHTNKLRSQSNVVQLDKWLKTVQQNTETNPERKDLEQSVGSVGGIIGIDLPGSWIFNADKKVWQGYLVARYVTNSQQPTFSLGEACKAVTLRYGVLYWMERLSHLKEAELSYLKSRTNNDKRNKEVSRLLYLEPSELPCIYSIEDVIKAYLDHLSHHPANLLNREGNEGQYRVIYESPEAAGAVINKVMASRVSRATVRGHKMRAASQVTDNRKAQAIHQEWERLIEAIGDQPLESILALKREDRNEACIERLQRAYDAGFKQIAYCSHCRHVNHASKQAKPCELCRVGVYRYASLGQREAAYHRRGFNMKPWHPNTPER